jgi:hypothetical protein
MSNTLYPKGAQKILSASINFASDTIKVAWVPSGYTYSTAHEFLSDLGSTVGTAQTLANKSVTGGVFDADDVDFGAIASGSTLKAAVLYKDTGVAGTSPLIAYLDEITGLPMATNGASIEIPWNNGAGKIISLVP